MSSPREAVYDVLLSKARRAREATAKRLLDEWERYEADNRAAHGTYMGQQPASKPNGRATS